MGDRSLLSVTVPKGQFNQFTKIIFEIEEPPSISGPHWETCTEDEHTFHVTDSSMVQGGEDDLLRASKEGLCFYGYFEGVPGAYSAHVFYSVGGTFYIHPSGMGGRGLVLYDMNPRTVSLAQVYDTNRKLIKKLINEGGLP